MQISGIAVKSKFAPEARGTLPRTASNAGGCKNFVGIVECLDSHFYKAVLYAIRIPYCSRPAVRQI